MEVLGLALAAGFGLGLASTLHCAGMCGSLAASVMLAGAPQRVSDAGRVLVLTHVGRVFGYALAGAAVGAIGSPVVGWFDREVAFRLVQWAGAVALLWIGLSTAGLLPPLSLFDRLLMPVSQRVARAARPLSGRIVGPFAAGLAWGLMPCAMVYGALFTAMLTGSAADGASVMAAFGLGTLPGLIIASAGIGALAHAGKRPNLRIAAGLAIGALGVLSVWMPQPMPNAFCAPGARASLIAINPVR